jgi:hypothetical protein
VDPLDEGGIADGAGYGLCTVVLADKGKCFRDAFKVMRSVPVPVVYGSRPRLCLSEQLYSVRELTGRDECLRDLD